MASEKKFIEAMKIPLPCPACKHVSNGLNMSMLENGSVVKGARQSASARFVSCLHIQRERRKKKHERLEFIAMDSVSSLTELTEQERT